MVDIDFFKKHGWGEVGSAIAGTLVGIVDAVFQTAVDFVAGAIGVFLFTLNIIGNFVTGMFSKKFWQGLGKKVEVFFKDPQKSIRNFFKSIF